jgi:hypothetical protein
MTRFTNLTLLVCGFGWSAIPFLLITIRRDIEEPFVLPLDASGDCLSPDPFHLVELRLPRAPFPSTDGALVHAGDPGERLLRFLEDIRSDVLDGVHGERTMPFGIICQWCRSAFSASAFSVAIRHGSLCL